MQIIDLLNGLFTTVLVVSLLAMLYSFLLVKKTGKKISDGVSDRDVSKLFEQNYKLMNISGILSMILIVMVVVLQVLKP